MMNYVIKYPDLAPLYGLEKSGNTSDNKKYMIKTGFVDIKVNSFYQNCQNYICCGALSAGI